MAGIVDQTGGAEQLEVDALPDIDERVVDLRALGVCLGERLGVGSARGLVEQGLFGEGKLENGVLTQDLETRGRLSLDVLEAVALLEYLAGQSAVEVALGVLLLFQHHQPDAQRHERDRYHQNHHFHDPHQCLFPS
jgi:hypothetical protein